MRTRDTAEMQFPTGLLGDAELGAAAGGFFGDIIRSLARNEFRGGAGNDVIVVPPNGGGPNNGGPNNGFNGGMGHDHIIPR